MNQIDKEKREGHVRQNIPDNSRLEELMSRELTAESQNECLELFKEFQLFMPVAYSPNMFEGI